MSDETPVRLTPEELEYLRRVFRNDTVAAELFRHIDALQAELAWFRENVTLLAGGSSEWVGEEAQLKAARQQTFAEIINHFGREWLKGVGLLEELEDLRDVPLSKEPTHE